MRMKKVLKMGTAALAFALALTMSVPVTAQAKAETKIQLHKNSYYSDSSDLIQENTTVVAGPFNRNTKDGETAFENAAVQGGFVAPDATGNYAFRRYNPNNCSCTGRAYYWKPGYSTKVESNNTVIIYKYYVNTMTGQTGTSLSEVNKRITKESAEYNKFQPSIKIKKGEITYLSVPLQNGDIEIGQIKSSKKSVVSAKKYNRISYVYNTDDNASLSYDKNDDGTYTYYYLNSVGEKVVVITSADSKAISDAKKTTNGSYAYKCIKLVGKKSGASKVSFDVFNKAGVKTGSVSVKVYVQDDTDILKTLTFGGKSLLDDYSSPKHLNYGKKSTDTLWGVSSKKKGKIVAKANKNYQIKKIEVGTLYAETTPIDASNATGSYESTTHKTGYDQTETFVYKTVKNGKVIKLSTQPYSDNYNNITNDTYSSSISKKYEDGSTLNANIRGLYAPTKIRVTYYNKLTKTYGIVSRTVYCKAK